MEQVRPIKREVSMSRQEMEQVLREGGSILHNPTKTQASYIIDSPALLPPELELAAHDREKVIATQERLRHQQQVIDEQLAMADRLLAEQKAAEEAADREARQKADADRIESDAERRQVEGRRSVIATAAGPPAGATDGETTRVENTAPDTTKVDRVATRPRPVGQTRP